MGGNPIGLAMSEVYLSLQTGAIDGQDNAVSTIISNSWQEVTESVTITGHMLAFGDILINESLWQSMTPELQQIISDGVEQAADYITETSMTQMEDDIAFLEQSGVSVYKLTDEELAAYREEVQEYYFANGGSLLDKVDMDLYQKILDLAN